MKTREISPSRLVALRGKRSREVIAHELRLRGHGTDAKAIWRWEKGHNQPSSRVLADIAEVLGVGSVEELFASDDDEEEAPAMAGVDVLEALWHQLGAALGKTQLKELA